MGHPCGEREAAFEGRVSYGTLQRFNWRNCKAVAVQVGAIGLDRHSCDSFGLASLKACIYCRLLPGK